LLYAELCRRRESLVAGTHSKIKGMGRHSALPGISQPVAFFSGAFPEQL